VSQKACVPSSAGCIPLGHPEELLGSEHAEARLRNKSSVLRPNAVRTEGEHEGDVRSVLRIPTSQQLLRLRHLGFVFGQTVIDEMPSKEIQRLVDRAGRSTHPRGELVSVGRDFGEEVIRHVDFVAPKDQEPSRAGVTQERRDDDVRVCDELQDATPGFLRAASPVLLPHAFLHLSSQFLNVPVPEIALAEEGVQSAKVLELPREGLAGDLAPPDLRVPFHLFVEVIGDAQGEVGHHGIYVIPRT